MCCVVNTFAQLFLALILKLILFYVYGLGHIKEVVKKIIDLIFLWRV